MKYRKKPVIIEAIQWTGRNLDEIINFCAGQATYESDNKHCHATNIGDFIIKGLKGEFYSIKNDIFRETYEKE